jgi:NAD(P)-dependent dehydrogenase (short-subunit alcohol dehydrogenase family)
VPAALLAERGAAVTPVGLQVRDAVVVITGGGSGIGAAMARRFAAEGADVIVNDLDGAAAKSVAEEIGGRAVPGDAADQADVRHLVDLVRTEHGGLDLFCANAGVSPPADPEHPDAAWELTWRVNVMAHVYAARALLPRWLADGQGRLLVTASAAGLLTMLGRAPYAISKHAAVAFAEWLRATYEHRGIVVQALCPQGVRTPMLLGARAAADARSAARSLLDAGAIAPDEVADCVIEAMSDDRFLVLPHPEVATYYARRATDPDRWLRGMNKLQRTAVDPAVGPAGTDLL